MKTENKIFLALILLSVLQVIYYYPQMPETMASHYNFQGEADDWTSKSTFFILYFVAMAIVIFIFLASRGILAKVPTSMVSLPNKGYWLLPENKARAFAILSSYIMWLGCATLAFFLGLFQLTFQASLAGRPSLGNGIWVLIGIYFVFTIIWTILIIHRFAKKPV